MYQIQGHPAAPKSTPAWGSDSTLSGPKGSLEEAAGPGLAAQPLDQTGSQPTPPFRGNSEQTMPSFLSHKVGTGLQTDERGAESMLVTALQHGVCIWGLPSAESSLR